LHSRGFAAALFDRDGTLIEDVPYNGEPALVRPVPGTREVWPDSVAEVRTKGLAAADVDVVLLQRFGEWDLAERWLRRELGRDVPRGAGVLSTDVDELVAAARWHGSDDGRGGASGRRPVTRRRRGTGCRGSCPTATRY
jgi:hypothetical protein